MWTQRKAKDYFEEEIIHGEKKNSIPKKTIKEFLERLALAETWLLKHLLGADDEVKAAALNVKLFAKKQNFEPKIYFGDLYVLQNMKTRTISFKLYNPAENKFVWSVDATDSSRSSKLDGYVDLKCNTHILHLRDSIFTFKFPDKKERALFTDNLNKFLYFEKLRELSPVFKMGSTEHSFHLYHVTFQNYSSLRKDFLSDLVPFRLQRNPELWVLITGSNRGIGLELTKQFVTHHDPPDKVIATCRNPGAASELQSLVKRFNNVSVLQLDVNKVDSFPAFVEKVKSIVGENGLNVLINNAGIIYRKANLEEVSYDDYLNVLHTNTVGPVFLTQALLPLIKRAASVNGEKEMSIKRAAVINMSSLMGSVTLTTRGYWGYSESKAALNQASRLLTSNVSMFGILVVDLHPGWVKTDLGGTQAHFSVEDSVANLMELIYNLSEYNNDTFLRFDGEEIPW